MCRDEEHHKSLHLDAFDESALEYHQQKYIGTAGVSWGFRASKERAELRDEDVHFDSCVPYDELSVEKLMDVSARKVLLSKHCH